VDRELVAAKFMLIKDNVKQLRKLAALPKEAFLADPIRRAAAERMLHISIEAAVDICSHVISVEKLRKPEHYADIPSILKEAHVLGEDVATSLVDMIKFRNILVHLYAVG